MWQVYNLYYEKGLIQIPSLVLCGNYNYRFEELYADLNSRNILLIKGDFTPEFSKNITDPILNTGTILYPSQWLYIHRQYCATQVILYDVYISVI